MKQMETSTRGVAELSTSEKREILELAEKRREPQAEIAIRYGVTRSTVSQIVHQHRKAVAGGMASLARAQMLAGAPVTMRRFSWEGADA